MGKFEYNLTPDTQTRIFAADDGETLPELLERIREWADQYDEESLWLNFIDLRIENDHEGVLGAEVRYMDDLEG